MKINICNFFLLTFFCLSCGGESSEIKDGISQNKSNTTKVDGTKVDKTLPKELSKPIVATIDDIEWESIIPIKVHHLNWQIDKQKGKQKTQSEYNLVKSLYNFSILNNGAMHGQINKSHLFSRDHGSNWHYPFFENGKSFSDSLGYFSVYHTPDFFVIQANNNNPTSKGKDQYKYFISFNGSFWEEASKHNFNFDDFVKASKSSLLYKKVNPQTFEKVKTTRPNDFHTIIYNMKDLTATIYPYKDDEYVLPKKLQFKVYKALYQLCNGDYVNVVHFVNYFERGSDLSNLEQLVYDIPDSLKTAGIETHFKEFGCTLSKRMTLPNKAPTLSMLSRDSGTPSKLEIVNNKSSNIYSSQNGKYMIRKDGLLSKNKNRVDCVCD